MGLTASGKKALLDVADQKRQNVEELRAALAESGCASANGEAAIAVLAAVEAHSRVFNAIEAGVKRNSSRWPVRYDLGFSMAPPPWPSLRQLTYLFAIRSLARRSAGMPQEAADDVVTLLRLARALQRDPLLVSTMIGVAIERAALSEIWDGMASHAWSGSCLARFRGELLDVDEFASWHRSVLFEGIAMTRLLESAIREEKPVWGLRDDESNEVHWAICRSAGGDDRIHHDP